MEELIKQAVQLLKNGETYSVPTAVNYVISQNNQESDIDVDDRENITIAVYDECEADNIYINHEENDKSCFSYEEQNTVDFFEDKFDGVPNILYEEEI